ncbi:MAG: FlgO family outer membrane protein [Elusimicrobiota bacterium]
MRKKLILSMFCFLFTVSAYCNIPTIAIAPFQNLTDNKNNDWLGISFSESLSTHLGNIKSLRVVERPQLDQIIKEMKLQMSGLTDENTFLEINKLLGAKYIIVGSVSKNDGYIKVNMRLLDVETGSVVTTNNMEGRINKIFDIQRKLAENTAKYFHKTLTKSGSETKSVTAEENYSKGVFDCWIVSDHKKAMGCFQKVVDENPDSPEGYYGLGFEYLHTKDYTNALEQFNYALKLYKQNKDKYGAARTYLKIGEIHQINSNYSDAIKYYKLSLKEDEIDTIYSRIAEIEKFMDNMDNAIKYQEKAVKIFKKLEYHFSYISGIYDLAKMYVNAGKHSKAIDILKDTEMAYVGKNQPMLVQIVKLREDLENK